MVNLAELAPVRRSPVEACEQLGDMSLVIRHAKVLGDKDGDAGIGPVVDKTMGRGPLLEKMDQRGLLLGVQTGRSDGGASAAQRLGAALTDPAHPVADAEAGGDVFLPPIGLRLVRIKGYDRRECKLWVAAGLKFNMQLVHPDISVYGDAAILRGYQMRQITPPGGFPL